MYTQGFKTEASRSLKEDTSEWGPMVVLCRAEEVYATLPRNYNFELSKTIRHIKRHKPARVALQFPDGLLKYAFKIKKILSEYAEIIVLGDVVYGACCVDDTSAASLECELLVHYGHSCLVDVTQMETRVLYVFVDISFDTAHLVEIFKANFRGRRTAVFGTIQYNAAVHAVKQAVDEWVAADASAQGTEIVVPQARPLSPGEVLGCTAPRVYGVECGVYVGDGRFHLESFMMQNPALVCYKYCPFTRRMTREEFVPRRRRTAVCGSVGIIQSALGRQGNPRIVDSLVRKVGPCYVFVLRELCEKMLAQFVFIDVFVQVGCPRLSIDWDGSFSKPLLTPFDVLGDGDHPMDYYGSGDAPWKN